MQRLWIAVPVVLVLAFGCTKKKDEAPAEKKLTVGLVTDVGGRGDGSFNDSALRGVELWAAGQRYEGGRYVRLSDEDVRSTLSRDLFDRSPPIRPVGIRPLVLQSKSQEDYEPNVQLL